MIKMKENGVAEIIETPSERISASEAIYGFAGWITCRKEIVKAGFTEDAAVWAELVDEWCKFNNLPEPRESVYPQNIKQPA